MNTIRHTHVMKDRMAPHRRVLTRLVMNTWQDFFVFVDCLELRKTAHTNTQPLSISSYQHQAKNRFQKNATGVQQAIGMICPSCGQCAVNGKERRL